MNKEKIFQQIKNELTEKEQMILASMLDGDTIIETAHNCGISVNYAQSYRKTIYEVVGQFVDYGSDKKAKQHILINFLDGYQTTATQTEESQPEENIPGEVVPAEEKTEISPVYQELFSYMLDQHDCTLLESEMQEVYRIVNDDLQSENQKLYSDIQKLATMHGKDMQTIKTKLCNALDIAFVPNETEFDEIFERIETLRREQDKNIFRDFKTKTPNYLVFNPKKGRPNKVYKNYQTALEDAKAVAKKEQQSVFVLHIDSLVVPHCSFDVRDVLESGIPERYLNDEIPF
jgi:hypothetical protein